MKKKNLQATSVGVYLALIVQVEDDTRPGRDYWAMPLLSLAWLLAAGLALQNWLTGLAWQFESAALEFDSLAHQVRLAVTLLGIGWRSIVWGLG